MKSLFIVFFLCFTIFIAAQNKNEMLTGTYYYYEMNEFEGDVTTTISEFVFNGTDSVTYTVKSPELYDEAKLPYTVLENGELIVPFEDNVTYHGTVKEDGQVFFMCLTDGTFFSNYSFGIGIKADPDFPGNGLEEIYNTCGYIPSSSLLSFNFTGRRESDSVFYCSGIPVDTVNYKILQNGKINFTAGEYLVESAFTSSGKIGIGCRTGGIKDGFFSAVNNNLILNDVYIDKKFKFVQFFDGYYKDASILEMNCHPDGTGNYVKKYFVNETGELTGTFTYSIKNNILTVIEGGDTLTGSITDDLQLFFLLRENANFAGFGAGIAEINNPVNSVNTPEEIPVNFSLAQNYPNPFNPATRIQYAIGNGSVGNNSENSEQLVTLKIYDILGNEVAALVNEHKAPGYYEVEFNADRYNLSSGIYFYQLKANEFTSTKKLLLLK